MQCNAANCELAAAVAAAVSSDQVVVVCESVRVQVLTGS